MPRVTLYDDLKKRTRFKGHIKQPGLGSMTPLRSTQNSTPGTSLGSRIFKEHPNSGMTVAYD
ncbi:hypothetical protein CCP3SC5AM1_220025 [Gammaproteobacteria bacterium]